MTGLGTRFIAIAQEAWSVLRMQGSALVESAAGSLRTEHRHYRPIRFRERFGFAPTAIRGHRRAGA